MKKFGVHRIRVIAAATGAGLCSLVNLDGQTFTGLGQIPDFESFRVSAISADGSTVIGTTIGAGGFHPEAFRWTSTGGIELLGILPGGDQSWGRGISNDGSTIVGGSNSASGFQAFRWTSTEGMIGLGTSAGGGSYALAISGDGTTIVGAITQPLFSDGFGGPAFRWTNDGGLQTLGNASGVAFDVSENGSVIVGGSIPIAFSAVAARWDSNGNLTPLGPAPNPVSGSVAYAVSGDGTTTVGVINGIAVQWKTTGEALKVDWTSGNLHSRSATDVNEDGSIIVGVADARGGSSAATDAFAWTPESGIIRLVEVLDGNSLFSDTFAGWSLYEANAISPDGRFITGSGRNPDGNYEAWLLDRGVDPIPFLPSPFQSVPEPSTYGLIGTAMLGALVTLRRWNKQIIT